MLNKFPHKLVVAAMGVTAALLVTGCATDTLQGDPLVQVAGSDRVPVALSITANTGEVRSFDEISVARVSPPGAPGAAVDKAEYLLSPVPSARARDTALFIGSLPPGEYTFKAFRSRRDNKLVNMDPKIGAANDANPEESRLLGKFNVHAGKRVDLGRLLLTPVNDRVIFGRMPGASSNLDLIRRFSPQHATLFSSGVEAGWNAADDRSEQHLAYALQRPVGLTCPTERADGTVIAASRLGSVLIRSAQGRWRAVHGPGVDTLLCVLPVSLPNAELLAVGEFGTLLRKPPGADKLVAVDPGNLPAGHLLAIAGTPARGWYVAQQSGKFITLYHSPLLEGGTWTTVHSEEVANSQRMGVQGFWMWNTKGGLAYALDKGEFRMLDFATGQWSTRTTPDKRRLIDVAPTGSGVGVLISPGFKFAGVYDGVYITRDDAQSWQQIRPPSPSKRHPALPAPGTSVLMVGGSPGEEQLYLTKDDGKNWTSLGAHSYWRQVLQLTSGDLLDFDFGAHGVFTVRHSGDGGRNWRVEHSTFDLGAAKALKK